MTDSKRLVALREAVRNVINDYQRALQAELANTPRGSGHADNKYDNLKASITEVKSAKRVLWMEDGR